MTGADIRNIWASLPLPCVVLTADDRILTANPAAEMFLNSSSAAFCGKPFLRWITMDLDGAGLLARARRSGAVLLHRDVPVTPRKGTPTICDVQIAPVAETPQDILVLFQPRNITGHLGKALQVKSAARTAIGLAEMLAHEIKNPLAGISGATQLLAMELGREDQKLTALILQETQRIVALLAEVEQFGDLRPPVLQPLNIHDILERARASASVGTAAHMAFTDDYDPSLPLTEGDPGQLSQVFANLLANAAEAGAKTGGTILLRTYFEPGLRLSLHASARALPLQIEVVDNGPGIAPDMLDQVFDPFVTGRENGTGLGLAVVSKIIAAHNGAVSVASRRGHTTFRISLPLLSAGKDAT